jgi:hypothetical protein
MIAGEVAAVVEDHVRGLTAVECTNLLGCTSQYSSSVSPFQANTGTPAAAIAAAAWSCVE